MPLKEGLLIPVLNVIPLALALLNVTLVKLAVGDV
jgi:hypothetical protein